MSSRAHSSVDAAHAGHAAAMPFDPRQPLPLRPAAVAVHDDGDVPRPGLERHVQCFGGGGRHGWLSATTCGLVT